MRAPLLALALCVLAVGCSMLRFAYTQLDTYAAWKADEYFDLDPQQHAEFMARFERLHRWHRFDELPRYAALLAETRARFLRGLGDADVLWFVQAAEERYRAIVAHGAGDAALLLATMTPAQIDTLRRQWGSDNARFVREHALNGTPADRRRATLHRSLERIRHWTGDLSDAQEQRIAALLDALPDIDRLRYADRLRRQREFLALMAMRQDAAFPGRLRHWLLHWEEGRDPAYERALSVFTADGARTIAEIGRMLTAAQREHVAARIGSYVETFRSLARRRSAAAR